MADNQWYARSVEETLALLKTSEDGLSHAEAEARFKEAGPNTLPERRRDSVFVIFVRQFQSPLIYILVAASAVVLALGEFVDAAVILAVLVFNAVVGAVQEGRAQETLRALKRYAQTQAVVRREKRDLAIPDSEVVPGDILVLHAGDKVPADARLILAHSLRAEESSLTGESGPVDKEAVTIKKSKLPVAEALNLVWKGTQIVAGSGVAAVVATGQETAIGRIVARLSEVEAEIPLKENIRRLSRLIMASAGGICGAIFLLGVLLGKTVADMFRTAVSLAVSIIPEGLPIVTTLVLATGVARMARRRALVKRLQAVEALGQAGVIAVDKTGTITRNELMAQEVFVAGGSFHIGGGGYDPRGDVSLSEKIVEPLNHPELLRLAKIAARVAAGRAVYDENNRRWNVLGDPTEAALAVFAEKLGFRKDALEEESPLVGALPFDSERKYQAAAHREGGKFVLSLAGAPEVVLDLSSISAADKSAIEKAVSHMSRQGLRVLALADSETRSGALRHGDVRNLNFVGLIGMSDALREEVPSALARSRAAGIRVVMITGDHKTTAEAVARAAGILSRGDSVITGAEIDAMSPAELAARIGSVSVFARVTPEHKLLIIEAFRTRGEVVAMTGDGVNDALSLTAADLGVAMGGIGTEVAKEAADIVLLDDDFGAIVSAVEEGRSIYKTIKKVILYLFSTSLGEALTIAGALAIGFPLPILPAQIIWLNFVTDGFLDVSLAMEPKEEGLLSRAFRRGKTLVDAPMGRRMLTMAVPMMAGTLALFSFYRDDINKGWTVSLTALAVFQWFNAWNCRHESRSLASLSPFSNPYLVAATVLIICLHLLAVYHPWFQAALRTVPLTLEDWLVIVPTATSIVAVEEARKWLARRRAPA